MVRPVARISKGGGGGSYSGEKWTLSLKGGVSFGEKWTFVLYPVEPLAQGGPSDPTDFPGYGPGG